LFIGHGTVVPLNPSLGGDFKFAPGSTPIAPSDMANSFGYGFGVAYVCSAPFAGWETIMAPQADFWRGHSFVQWIGADWQAVKAVIDKAK
jgi:hypothetical protein